jgi:beta-N-acetylhexosaminidase
MKADSACIGPPASAKCNDVSGASRSAVVFFGQGAASELPRGLRSVFDGLSVGSHSVHRDQIMRRKLGLSVCIGLAAVAPATAVSPDVKSILTSANPERLARIGRHVMAGADSIDAMRILVEKRAVMGLFITDHNVKGKTAAEVRAKIDALQAIRVKQGLPPLIIAADQEGGPVSRLSPPLELTPSLATTLLPPLEQERVASAAAAQAAYQALVAKAGKRKPLPPPPELPTATDANLLPLDTEADKQSRIEVFAKAQATALADIGVNLNFAPVVDLKVPLAARNDGETMLDRRAISPDPDIVTKTAGWYCATLMSARVGCTLKHFPGLGRITNDTHQRMATLAATKDELQSQDWMPYKALMQKSGTVTMLGHVRMTAIDDKEPASFSEPLIQGLIRKDWAYDGVLITDDFSMGAVLRAPGGAGGSAVKSLNAGADIVLVSWSERHLAGVLSALLTADARGKIDPAKLLMSQARIAKVVADLTGPVAATPTADPATAGAQP